MTAPARFPRRLAAVWFADIVGYTRLAAEDENAALGAVERFQRAAREVTASQQGRLVKFLGDAALVEFPSAHGAIVAGLSLLETFGRNAAGQGRSPVLVRVGVHVGEVAPTPEGDLLGDDVNLASRIHTAAEPGQVVVSEDVVRQLRHRHDWLFEPLGERELKGVPEIMRLFVVRAAGTGRAPRAGSASPHSIAVLPFANMSADPTHEYFSDGIMEEILTSLAQIEGLKVISRTSAMRYKGTNRGIRQIGEELGVATILEGSVRHAGERVRITAQLIDARTDEHLWASRYDRDLEDIFAIQSDVAERIVEALKGRLTPMERERLSGAPTEDVTAYKHYLRGVHFWNRRVQSAFHRAIAEYEAAIELDPSYAQAWAGLAGVYAIMGEWDPAEAREKLRLATDAVERALAIDSGLGIAHAMLAQVHMREWRWDAADHHFRQGVELAPGDATTRQWHAHFLATMGRSEEAQREIERALELDPLSLPVQTQAALVHLLARRFEEAEQRLKQALEIDPWFLPAGGNLANLYHRMGRHDEARAEWHRLGVRAEVGGDLRPDAHLADAIARSRDVGAPPGFVALLCAAVGRVDEAFGYLEKALASRDFTVATFRLHPMLDSLRSDPRFGEILRRCGLA